jgi:excisionase family DNA binding protein
MVVDPQPLPSTEAVLSTTDAAHILGVSRQTIYTWLKSGQLRASMRLVGGAQRGGRYRFTLEALERAKHELVGRHQNTQITAGAPTGKEKPAARG